MGLVFWDPGLGLGVVKKVMSTTIRVILKLLFPSGIGCHSCAHTCIDMGTYAYTWRHSCTNIHICTWAHTHRVNTCPFNPYPDLSACPVSLALGLEVKRPHFFSCLGLGLVLTKPWRLPNGLGLPTSKDRNVSARACPSLDFVCTQRYEPLRELAHHSLLPTSPSKI